MKIARKKIPKIVQERVNLIFGYDAIKNNGGFICKKGIVPTHWVVDELHGNLWAIENLQETEHILNTSPDAILIIIINDGLVFRPIIKHTILKYDDVTDEWDF